MEMTMGLKKDLGQQKIVMDSLPYAVVGGAFKASFENAVDQDSSYHALGHNIPTGHQLKLLFLRVWTQNENGAKFHIEQHNPTAVDQFGSPETYPVVGAVPSGIRDYPMLESAGAEVLRGSLIDPIHVFEGSIEFCIQGPIVPSGDKYGIVWWGVEKNPPPG